MHTLLKKGKQRLVAGKLGVDTKADGQRACSKDVSSLGKHGAALQFCLASIPWIHGNSTRSLVQQGIQNLSCLVTGRPDVDKLDFFLRLLAVLPNFMERSWQIYIFLKSQEALWRTPRTRRSPPPLHAKICKQGLIMLSASTDAV